MAATQIGPSKAVITLAASYLGDVQRFSIDESQAFEDTSPIGPNTSGRVMGSGLSKFAISAGGFLRTTGNPGFGLSSSAGNDNGVGSITWLVFTGMQFVFTTSLFSNTHIDVDRLKGAVPFNWSIQPNSDPTITWA